MKDLLFVMKFQFRQRGIFSVFRLLKDFLVLKPCPTYALFDYFIENVAESYLFIFDERGVIRVKDRETGCRRKWCLFTSKYVKKMERIVFCFDSFTLARTSYLNNSYEVKAEYTRFTVSQTAEIMRTMTYKASLASL